MLSRARGRPDTPTGVAAAPRRAMLTCGAGASAAEAEFRSRVAWLAGVDVLRELLVIHVEERTQARRAVQVRVGAQFVDGHRDRGLRLAPITDYGLWIIDPAHPGNNPDYFRLWIIDLAHRTNNPDYCRLWIITLAYPTPT